MLRKRIALLTLSAAIVTIVAIGCQQQTQSNLSLKAPSQSLSAPRSAPFDQNGNSIVGAQTNASQTATSTENSTWYPAHRTKGNNGEDIVFIDSQHGWKMEGGGVATGANPVTIYRTEDGGKNWTKISDTNPQTPKSLPKMGLKTGITFLDSSTGWVGLDEPAPEPEVYVTHDGGQTWERQALPIMENSGLGGFVLSPPTFFTKQDGIIIFNNVNSLWYVTHDGGKSWILCQEYTRAGSNGNLSWNFSGIDRNYDPVMNGHVTINGVTWNTKDGGHSWTNNTK